MLDPDADLRPILGGRTAAAFADILGVRTVDDALRRYPRRYLRRGELTNLADLRVDDEVTILAEVVSVSSRQTRPQRGRKAMTMTEVVVTDGSGELTITFFNQRWREGQLRPGTEALFAGKVGSYRGRRQLVHPDFLELTDSTDHSAFAGAIIPVYAATSRLRSWRIRDAIALLLPEAEQWPDPIAEDIRAAHGLIGLSEALHGMHDPPDLATQAAAEFRLKWEEAFVLQTQLLRRRAERRAATAVPRQLVGSGLVAALDATLPYELTRAQKTAADEIAADMAKDHPMLRLLQGDVGSGKTVVALRAMLATVDSGAQAALMAPTEVLAVQHFQTFQNLLGPLGRRGQLDGDPDGTRIELLTGSVSASERARILADVASGDIGIVVGTHALFSVEFAELGLVVVDEQHRFGVEQRASLAEGGADARQPHQLVMTATPIPRTVAITMFGDLDVSTLDELPAGRQPVQSHVVSAAEHPTHVGRAWQRVREEVAAGGKVYVVCPRISAEQAEEVAGQGAGGPGEGGQGGDGEGGQRELPVDLAGARDYPPTAVSELVPYLQSGPLAGLRLAGLHGRMTPEDKAAVMARFAGPADQPEAVDVLVSTTVIEVGVDVPAATMMVIIDAQRFGVSSLHQLRGRVGRGSAASLCLFLTYLPADDPGYERLARVAATNDGFEVSQIDLEMRREGDVLGAQQHGRASSLRLLSVLRDGEIIAQARAAAEALLANDPTLADQPALAGYLQRLDDRRQAEFLERA